ncbi:MAG: penicillin-binding protein 2 [bacterium]|jgi:penicillin-binding protein 2
MSAYFIEKDHRARIAGVLLIIALMVIISGLFYHQIIRYKSFLAQSEENRIRIRPIIPKRGVIYDRNMEMIADNRLSFTVSIVPMEMEKDVTIPRLAELTGADTSEIKQKLNANFISKYIPAAVRRDQDIGVISTLEENGAYYPGVTYSVESVRRYAEGISAETFIGYIAEVAPDEIDNESQWGYRPGRLIGKKGIEKAYDRELRGIEGTDFIEVSARGQIIGPYSGKDRVPAVPGADLVLSIDAALQREIVKFYDSLQASGGVVALDPTTGEILALASFPGLDPNLFSGVIPDEIWRSIIDDPRHPLLNRPTSSMYPPGSTAKLLTAGAALERGVLTPETMLRGCGGGMRFGNRVFKCWREQGHGRLDLYHAIEQSCNVYFYQVGQILGLDAWNEFAVKCGFGKKSGIDISGELSGIAPSRAYYDKAFGPNRWSKLLVLNIAIGQGEFIVTPLQLAQFYAGLANGGKVFKPHLLKEIRYPGRSVQKIEPSLSFTLPFSQNTLSVLSSALGLVVQGEHGTAKGLRNKYYTIAGKTGTAQNPHGKDHSWFVGYAPSNAPRILVCALVENAGHGSEVAAPLAGRIIKRYLLGDSTQNVIAQNVAESPVME